MVYPELQRSDHTSYFLSEMDNQAASGQAPTRRNAKENLFLIPTGQATLPCPTFGPCPTLSYFCPKSQTPDKHWTKWAKIQNTPIESRESSVFVARNETQKGAVNQAK